MGGRKRRKGLAYRLGVARNLSVGQISLTHSFLSLSLCPPPAYRHTQNDILVPRDPLLPASAVKDDGRRQKRSSGEIGCEALARALALAPLLDVVLQGNWFCAKRQATREHRQKSRAPQTAHTPYRGLLALHARLHATAEYETRRLSVYYPYPSGAPRRSVARRSLLCKGTSFGPRRRHRGQRQAEQR